MPAKLFLTLVFIVFSGGCSNLMQADLPDHVFAEVHEFGTTALAYTPDGRSLISGGFRGELKRWDLAGRQSTSLPKGHTSAVRAILPLSPRALASGGDDGRLILWQGNAIKAQTRGESITALAWFQGRIVSAHSDQRLRFWSPDSLQLLGELPFDADIAALSARRDRLAVGLTDRIVLLDSALKPRTTLATRGVPHDLQFSPDGNTLAAGSWFRLHVWDIQTGMARSIPTEHNGLLTSVAFSPNGKQLVTLGRHTDSAIRILDTRDFSVVRRYQAHELCGAMIRYSPDGRMLASASDDESVRLYRLDRPSQIPRPQPAAH
ncbi:MAG: hypothetical protein ABL877_10135 [Thiobacillus sp.]